MTLNDIAIHNLLRRKGKTVFLFLTFFLIVGTIATLNILSLGMKENLQKSLNQYGANIVVSTRSEELLLSYGGLSVSSVDYEVKKLQLEALDTILENVESTVTVAPKVVGTVDYKNQLLENQQLFVVGLDFNQELKMKPWMKIQGEIPQNNEIVLGAQLASTLGLRKGDMLELGKNHYTIAGVMAETGGTEDSGIFANINTAREFTGIESEWSLIELNSPDSEKTVATLAEILPQANVSEVTQLVQSSKESVERLAYFAKAITIAMGFIGALVVVVTLAGDLNSRTQELGILRAIGYRQNHILSLLVREVVIVCISGSFAGYLVGVLTPSLVGAQFVKISIPLKIHPEVGFTLLLCSLVVALLGVVYPARRILKV